MGTTQTKRTQGIDSTIAANANASFTISSEEPCNIHGLITDVFVGNTGAGLNFGHWGVYLLPRTSTGVPVPTTGNLNTEIDSAVTWMTGTWMCNTESVAHIGGAPRSSRNCPRGGRLVLVIENSALSASLVRVHGVQTWFETIK